MLPDDTTSAEISDNISPAEDCGDLERLVRLKVFAADILQGVQQFQSCADQLISCAETELTNTIRDHSVHRSVGKDCSSPQIETTEPSTRAIHALFPTQEDKEEFEESLRKLQGANNRLDDFLSRSLVVRVCPQTASGCTHTCATCVKVFKQ